MTGTSSQGTGPTVYFDGSCPLCRAEIAHYASRPGAEGLDFVDVSREQATLGADLSREKAMGRFHVRRADGTLVSGARGFVEVWANLPGWQWAARAVRLPGVTPMLEGGYRLFLPLRPTLARAFGKLARAKSGGPSRTR